MRGAWECKDAFVTLRPVLCLSQATLSISRYRTPTLRRGSIGSTTAGWRSPSARSSGARESARERASVCAPCTRLLRPIRQTWATGTLGRDAGCMRRRHLPLFLARGGELDPELAVKCTTIRDFDDAVTRVVFGAPAAPLFLCLPPWCAAQVRRVVAPGALAVWKAQDGTSRPFQRLDPRGHCAVPCLAPRCLLCVVERWTVHGLLQLNPV